MNYLKNTITHTHAFYKKNNVHTNQKLDSKQKIKKAKKYLNPMMVISLSSIMGIISFVYGFHAMIDVAPQVAFLIGLVMGFLGMVATVIVMVVAKHSADKIDS